MLQVYEEVAHQLEQQLDPRTRHLLVLTGVPLVFPHVPRSAVQQEVSLTMDMDCVGSRRAAARGWAQVACPEAQCSTR